MERVDKENAMMKFAACLMSIIDAKKKAALESPEGKVRKSELTSLRKLAASSGVDYATIQKIATGKKNPAWTTTILLMEGLQISLEEWGRLYDRMKDKDVAAFKSRINIQAPRATKNSTAKKKRR